MDANSELFPKSNITEDYCPDIYVDIILLGRRESGVCISDLWTGDLSELVLDLFEVDPEYWDGYSFCTTCRFENWDGVPEVIMGMASFLDGYTSKKDLSEKSYFIEEFLDSLESPEEKHAYIIYVEEFDFHASPYDFFSGNYYIGKYKDIPSFCMEYLCDASGFNIPDFLVIDWESTWNANLRHELSAVENGDGDLFFYHI